MTEAEKLARTIRRLIHATVGLALVIVVGLGGPAAVRWGWDAATTSRDERVAACRDTIAERVVGTGGAFMTLQRQGSACCNTDGNVNEAIKLVENDGYIPLCRT